MQYDSIFKPGLFTDQTIIVTGGGSGIGRCTAHELSALGATTILVGRTREKLEKVVGEIEEDNGKADMQVCDIRDEANVKTMVESIIKTHGNINGLVNNAGGQFPSPMEKISKKGFDVVIASNLTGGFLMAREVFNQSMQKTGGSIVNIIADMWGGMPGMAHSGAARSGMENLTRTAAYEWGCANVRVNSVAPGWIASSGMDTYDGSFKTIIPKLKQQVPLKRMGTESEVSSAICFLLSRAATFITGTTIQVDGAAPLGSGIWPLAEARNKTVYDGFHRSVLPDVLKDEGI